MVLPGEWYPQSYKYISESSGGSSDSWSCNGKEGDLHVVFEPGPTCSIIEHLCLRTFGSGNEILDYEFKKKLFVVV